MSVDSTMDEGPSSQLLDELHNTVSTSEHDSFDLASPRKEDVDPTQQTLFFPNAQGDWLSPLVHSSSSSSAIHAMKAAAAASRAASNAGNSDGSSAGPGASTPGTSENGDSSTNGHRGHGNVDAPGDEEMDDSMADEENNDGVEDDEQMKGTANISLYKYTPLGLSEEGTGEIFDEDGDVDTEDPEDAVHGRPEADKDGGDVTTEGGEEVVHGVPEDTIPGDAIHEDTIPEGAIDEDAIAEDAILEDAEKAAVELDMSDAPENAPIVIDDGDLADDDSLLMQVPELSKEQKAHKALHQKAWNLIPHKQAPARYWVAVLHHTVEPKEVRKEKDFLWIKANHRNTVETIWHTYQNATTEDVFSLHVSGEHPEFEDQLEELDFYSDKLVVFNVKLPTVEKEKKKKERRKGGENTPIVIDDD